MITLYTFQPNVIETPFLDKVIFGLIVLLVLSTVTEKFITLFRKYPIQLQMTLFLGGGVLQILIFNSRDSISAYCLWMLLTLLAMSAIILSILEGLYQKRSEQKQPLPGRDRFVAFLECFKSTVLGGVFIWMNPFRNSAKKPENDGKTETEKQISLLSIVIGFFVAFAFDVSLFDFINGELSFTESFPNIIDFENFKFNPALQFSPKNFIGLLFTGFFLSFGSKFFHDLLDRFYYIKKAKQALADPQLATLTSSDEVLEFVEDYPIYEVYEAKGREFIGQYGIRGFAIERDNSNKEVLVIKSTKPLDAKVTNAVSQYRSGGKTMQIPFRLEFCRDANPELTNGASMTEAIKNHHDNPTNNDLGGQICAPIQYKGEGGYFLTCYHVVKSRRNTWDLFLRLVSINTVGQSGGHIGDVKVAKRSLYYEMAIVRLNAGLQLDTHGWDLLSVKIKHATPRKLTSADNGAKVHMYSRVLNRLVEGKIKYAIDSETFDLPHNNRLFDLIRVESSDGRHIQEKGDSGSLLVHEDGYPIGMVFARSFNQCTYAMSLDRITSDYDLKIKL